MPVMAVSQAVPAGSDASFQQTLIEQQQAAEPASRANAVLEHTESWHRVTTARQKKNLFCAVTRDCE